MSERILNKSSFSTVSRACMTVFWYCGNATAARMMMIEITIINSSSVKPFDCELRIADCGLSGTAFKSAIRDPKSEIFLPVTILLSIQRFAARLRMHIEDILTAPRGCIDGVVTGSKIPIRFARHRIDRNLPQIDFRLRDG